MSDASEIASHKYVFANFKNKKTLSYEIQSSHWHAYLCITILYVVKIVEFVHYSLFVLTKYIAVMPLYNCVHQSINCWEADDAMMSY
jgi:hypothetical protein